ncbi:MAG: hypothetical protein KJ667_04190 [Alphaproteobacteria bacterium]|nr:hypothetical protein [Alphaproteobacteria bacterium]
MSPPGLIAYELKGESLDAAIMLDLRVRDYLTRFPGQRSGNLLDIHMSYKQRYQEALAEIRKTDPDLLKKCGLDHATVQVEQSEGAYPRTYESFPTIYATTAKQALYLMYVPVDYKGQHFIPQDAVPCDDKDFTGTDMGHSIYKKHFWVAEGPVVDGGRRGLPVPSDFDPATSQTIPSHGLRPDRCFKAGGDTLYTLDLLAQQRTLFETTFNAFTEATRAWVTSHMPGHYANFSLSEDKTLQLSIRVENSGTPVALNHPDWIIDKQIERDWMDPQTRQMKRIVLNEYEARPIPDTPEGLKLYMLFKAMPVPPRTHHHADLAIQSGSGEHSPVVHKYPQGTFLAYHGIKPTEKITPPKGCTEVPPTTLIWLDRDRTDRQWGIEPPPVPTALSFLYHNAPPNTSAPRPPQL